MSKQLSGYDLSRNYFDWAFENSNKVNPNHAALYFYIVEHCNRLGWKPIFGLPSGVAMEAIGVRSYNTYIKTLNELIEFGFIKMIEKSKNQYTANIIALSNINKALDKALIMHSTKHLQSTVQSIDSIIKQINNKQQTIKPQTIKDEGKPSVSVDDFSGSDFFNACKDVWFKHNPEWQFEGKDGAGIKSLIKKISKAQEDAGKEITPDATAAALDYILKSLSDDKFYSTADPSTLNSKFNSIIKILKSKSNGTTNNPRANAYTNSIFA